jgi:hypothetical protein
MKLKIQKETVKKEIEERKDNINIENLGIVIMEIQHELKTKRDLLRDYNILLSVVCIEMN